MLAAVFAAVTAGPALLREAGAQEKTAPAPAPGAAEDSAPGPASPPTPVGPSAPPEPGAPPAGENPPALKTGSPAPGEAGGGAAAPAAAGPWKIALTRPRKVGDRISFSATGHQDVSTVVIYPDRPRETTHDKLHVNYSGIHEVKAVDDQGRPTELLLRIDRLITDDGSGPMDQFPAGTLVTATSQRHEVRYLHNGIALEGTLSDALEGAGARPPAANEPSEDEVFGNDGPRDLGGTWTAAPARLARAFNLVSAFRMDPESARGTLRLEKALTGSQPPALSISGEFSLTPTAIVLQGNRRPLTDSSFKATLVRQFPLDPSLPVLHEAMTSEIRLELRDFVPEATKTEIITQSEFTRRILPLPGKEEKTRESAAAAPAAPDRTD